MFLKYISTRSTLNKFAFSSIFYFEVGAKFVNIFEIVRKYLKINLFVNKICLKLVSFYAIVIKTFEKSMITKFVCKLPLTPKPVGPRVIPQPYGPVQA